MRKTRRKEEDDKNEGAYQTNAILVVNTCHNFNFLVEQQEFLVVSCFTLVNNFHSNNVRKLLLNCFTLSIAGCFLLCRSHGCKRTLSKNFFRQRPVLGDRFLLHDRVGTTHNEVVRRAQEIELEQRGNSFFGLSIAP